MPYGFARGLNVAATVGDAEVEPVGEWELTRPRPLAVKDAAMHKQDGRPGTELTNEQVGHGDAPWRDEPGGHRRTPVLMAQGSPDRTAGTHHGRRRGPALHKPVAVRSRHDRQMKRSSFSRRTKDAPELAPPSRGVLALVVRSDRGSMPPTGPHDGGSAYCPEPGCSSGSTVGCHGAQSPFERAPRNMQATSARELFGASTHH